ncbi:hypothetical protein BC936DRAFT_148924 [Jimgerdemannia flammicorona]|uniref:Uncharacterized protein n=1 Tax=Jimgerdemannia flammicorona TaxID=994334 RepID=A0A433D211_9FUNG|nr:hypothetical protein BC936DRAFT_148924 [Jimgerdemannia flammicorona]
MTSTFHEIRNPVVDRTPQSSSYPDSFIARHTRFGLWHDLHLPHPTAIRLSATGSFPEFPNFSTVCMVAGTLRRGGGGVHVLHILDASWEQPALGPWNVPGPIGIA